MFLLFFFFSVESTLLKGVLDSSDAELVYSKDEADEDSDNSDSDSNDDGIINLQAMPIEIKARVSHSTFYAERHLLEANL